MIATPATGQDPESVYRARFAERLLNFAPRSVLDVGCGTGTLLASLGGRVERRYGVDVDPAKVEQAQAAGLAVTAGDAYELQFAASAVDLVTFQYVPHHLADWPRALSEALRVAGIGVLVLEGWYDRSIPSQETAARLEDWSKAIDRATGMVHANYPSVQQLVECMPLGTMHRIEAQNHLLLRGRDLDDVRREAEEQLAKLPAPNRARDDLRQHLARAEHTGVSCEGALILSVLAP